MYLFGARTACLNFKFCLKEAKKYSTINTDGHILGQLVAINKDDNQVDLEINFEFGVVIGWTGVNLGE